MEPELNNVTLASEDSTLMNNIQPVCKFNQIGFCKFGSSCHKMYVNTLCPNQNCSKKKCSDRHPRTCKYFSLNGSKCAFEHRIGENIKKIEEAESELQKLRLEVEIQKENLLKGEINNLKKEIQELKENASSNSKHIQSLYDIINKTTNKSSESTESLSNKSVGSLNCEFEDFFSR